MLSSLKELIDQHPPLTFVEEIQLAEQDDGRQLLVLHNLSHLEKLAHRHHDPDEAWSLGYDAMTRAAERWEPKATRFWAYARTWVRHALRPQTSNSVELTDDLAAEETNVEESLDVLLWAALRRVVTVDLATIDSAAVELEISPETCREVIGLGMRLLKA